MAVVKRRWIFSSVMWRETKPTRSGPGEARRDPWLPLAPFPSSSCCCCYYHGKHTPFFLFKPSGAYATRNKVCRRDFLPLRAARVVLRGVFRGGAALRRTPRGRENCLAIYLFIYCRESDEVVIMCRSPVMEVVVCNRLDRIVLVY